MNVISIYRVSPPDEPKLLARVREDGRVTTISGEVGKNLEREIERGGLLASDGKRYKEGKDFLEAVLRQYNNGYFRADLEDDVEKLPPIRVLNKASLEKQIEVVSEAPRKFVIAGYASPHIVDKQGHEITLEALKEDLPRFMADPRYAPIMVLHSNVRVGTIIPRYTDDSGKTYQTEVDNVGLFIVAEIRTDANKPEVVDKVIRDIEAGHLKSFSISGNAQEMPLYCEEGKCWHKVTKLELLEISLCEKGINQLAKFEVLAKADCGQGCVIHKYYEMPKEEPIRSRVTRMIDLLGGQLEGLLDEHDVPEDLRDHLEEVSSHLEQARLALGKEKKMTPKKLGEGFATLDRAEASLAEAAGILEKSLVDDVSAGRLGWVPPGQEPPPGVQIITGPRGGRYYKIPGAEAIEPKPGAVKLKVQKPEGEEVLQPVQVTDEDRARFVQGTLKDDRKAVAIRREVIARLKQYPDPEATMGLQWLNDRLLADLEEKMRRKHGAFSPVVTSALSRKQLEIAKTKIRKHYGLKRSISDNEVEAEVANLRRRAEAAILDDSGEQLAASLETGAHPITMAPAAPVKAVEPAAAVASEGHWESSLYTKTPWESVKKLDRGEFLIFVKHNNDITELVRDIARRGVLPRAPRVREMMTKMPTTGPYWKELRSLTGDFANKIEVGDGQGARDVASEITKLQGVIGAEARRRGFSYPSEGWRGTRPWGWITG